MSRIGTVASAAATAAALAFLLTSIPAQSAHASAAAKPAPLTWMAKTADIARVTAYFGGLSPAVAVPAFGWHLCGGPYNDKCPVPLAAGDVPVMASEAAMLGDGQARLRRAGHVRPGTRPARPPVDPAGRTRAPARLHLPRRAAPGDRPEDEGHHRAVRLGPGHVAGGHRRRPGAAHTPSPSRPSSRPATPAARSSPS